MSPTPPQSPSDPSSQRPLSSMIRASRSDSRTSTTSKRRGGSRASDDDGKTAVRVAVRLRPPLGPSDPGFDLIPPRFQRSIAHVTSPTGLTIDVPQGRKLFVFDRVFGPDLSQEAVWDYLSESVDAFVQGYNVSVLAYGQSGSGKSYTMGTSGPADQNDARLKGVVPRAAAALFAKLSPLSSDRRDAVAAIRPRQRYSLMSTPFMKPDPDQAWTMKATYVEIYNEQLRDLLVPESIPLQDRSPVIIREDVKGRIILTGLHQVQIRSIEDLLEALDRGSSIRQTDATAINAQSSRSHAVLSLNLVQRRPQGAVPPPSSPSAGDHRRRSVPLEATSGAESEVMVDSKLHFVDLAGSERLKHTGAQGDRAKEGISINAGLASLGKVIAQLSTRQPGAHVSYRDSKLTRLLQDSLGGNALTYMVACVTPAEFHLSETLNTVQYAQRARAIQSKPQIQQVSDEADQRAVIDRLRAEIAFLRDRVRATTDREDGPTDGSPVRADRPHEREIELQNQLLDIQESYSALGQRHARLIAEMAKAQEPIFPIDDHAQDLTRSRPTESFAAAAEHVLLEYERTIQTLEASLSRTRSSLSATESDLLERETKCVYVETVNQQLESRLQKMMDREAGTEHYLHELETKLDGHSSGEEDQTAIVVELRKEMARIRENEASCEDYISTLEDRLAESDQDAELMQREIDRLEHVVERQRGLGKLDALMYELDHIQPAPFMVDPTTPIVDRARVDDGVHRRSLGGHHDGGDVASEVKALVVPSGQPSILPRPSTTTPTTTSDRPDTTVPSSTVVSDRPGTAKSGGTARGLSPATGSTRSDPMMAEKLATVTQDLLDLQVEHENTRSDRALLSAKYEDALRTVSQLQDAVDEARHPPSKDVFATPASTRPSSFLGDVTMTDAKDGGGGPTQPSSSRSLSSELYLAGESPDTSEPSDVEAVIKRGPSLVASGSALDHRPPALMQELDRLKRSQREKDESIGQLTERYDRLQREHQAILDEVEELKTEVSKAKMNNVNHGGGGTGTGTAPLIRRKSSQGVMMVDRAHRSFASLRNIASENLEDRPDVMQSFEINLNTALHELYARSERVQELEAEIATVKKEMETKMTIISGLTRERSSMKRSSPMDISVVATMRDQLLQSENKIRVLQEMQAIRETTFVAEIEELKASVPATSTGTDADAVDRLARQEQRIVDLQGELGTWEERHRATVESMQASESRLLATIREMETVLDGLQPQDVTREFDDDTISSLRRTISDYSRSVDRHADRVEELEQAHVVARREVDVHAQTAASRDAELRSNRELVTTLEQRLLEHQASIRTHEERLRETEAEHAREMEGSRRQADADLRRQLDQQALRHQDFVRSLQAEVTEARDEMGRLLQGIAVILKGETDTNRVIDQVQALADHRVEAEQAQMENATLRATIAELSQLHEQSSKEIDRLNEDYLKSSRIVEDLEEQLTANFDQHQATNNRLSVLEGARNLRVEELVTSKNQAVAELEAAKEEMARLEAKLYQSPTNDPANPDEGRARSSSITSNLRKSASAASLPSPPPAIPLPPLPGNASPMVNGLASSHSTTGTGSNQAGRNLSSPLGHHAQPPADDFEARLRTIENALFSEKQLNFALEEAIGDMETQGKKTKEDLDTWKKKAWAYEDEIQALKSNQQNNRYSMQAVEEARTAHRKAEAARAQLEERMNALNKKKKKGSLNCF